jgi:hypothetical protein
VILALLLGVFKGETGGAVRHCVSLSLLLLVGCAVASSEDDRQGQNDASIVGRADASANRPDAAIVPPMPDADTQNTIDADSQCTTQPTDLLSNGNFDLGPTMWTEVSDFGLITSDADIQGVDADTPPYLAWLGGYLAASGTTNSDEFYQDFAVPGDATPAAVRGMIWIDSEDSDFFAYDSLNLEVVDPNSGAVLETVASWSNVDKGTGWVAFDHGLTSSYAGQSIRLRFTATVDDLLRTSFLLDSLLVETTSCQ